MSWMTLTDSEATITTSEAPCFKISSWEVSWMALLSSAAPTSLISCMISLLSDDAAGSAAAAVNRLSSTGTGSLLVVWIINNKKISQIILQSLCVNQKVTLHVFWKLCFFSKKFLANWFIDQYETKQLTRKNGLRIIIMRFFFSRNIFYEKFFLFSTLKYILEINTHTHTLNLRNIFIFINCISYLSF